MKVLSKSDAETRDIGYRLGKSLSSGAVVCLYGELGAGKTTMVKGIASAFGIHERDITSASYTIIAEYAAEVPFYHIDLYRLKPEDVAELGLQEYFRSDSVAVIEWAERAQQDLPDRTVSVRFSFPDGNRREIEIEGAEC